MQLKNYISLRDQFPVTLDADLDRVTDGISLNASGAVTFVCGSGRSVTRNLLAGVDYPYRITRVNAIGTDADLGIHALYF